MTQIFKVLMLAFLVSSCVTLSSGEVSVKTLSSAPKGPKIVTFLNQTPYLADLSIALAENGFVVKPMPSQKRVTEAETSARVVEYKEASARYGISFQNVPAGAFCAFTSYHLYHFTLILTDIQSNEVVAVIKQTGSDGPCSSVQPVFGTMASALAGAW